MHDATLLLIGHGSSRRAEAAGVLSWHADRIRRRGLFGSVQACFWRQEPHLGGILATLTTQHVVAVPFFISDGHFTREVIPKELGLRRLDSGEWPLSQYVGTRLLVYAPPVGAHERLTEAVLEAARRAMERSPFPWRPCPAESALILAGHGAVENKSSRQILEHQAAVISKTGQYAEAGALFLEEDPRVSDAFKLFRAKHWIVVPCFVSEADHSMVDVPVMLGQAEAVVRRRQEAGLPAWRNPTEIRGRRIWYAEILGALPIMTDLLIEQACRTWQRAEADICERHAGRSEPSTEPESKPQARG